MKKTVSFSIIALIGIVAIAATMKISDYPAKTFLTGTELFLLADGSTNAKMTATSLNAALTNVAGLRVGAIIRTANGAALTNLTFTELFAANNYWIGSNYFPIVAFGTVTADSNTMNFANSVVMANSASNLVAWDTNLAYATFPTNIISRTPFFIGGGSANGVTLNTTVRYTPMFGGLVTTSTDANALWPVPTACTITNLYVKVATVTGAGTNLTFTVMTNGVASGITCSFVGNGSGNQSCTNKTAFVRLLEGDSLSLKYVGNDANNLATTFYFTFCYY